MISPAEGSAPDGASSLVSVLDRSLIVSAFAEAHRAVEDRAGSFVSSLTRTDGVLVRKPRGPATVRTTGLLGSIAAISTWPLRASGGATGRRLLRGAAT